jgi:tRNA(adenine34) deaminase
MKPHILKTASDLLPQEGGSQDEIYMREAFLEALMAWDEDEVPVGAVIVKDGHIIARAHNRREASKLPTDHAELKAIEKAARELGSWRLDGASLFVTLEPCCMCAGAMVHARLKRVIWGADDPKAGAGTSLFSLLDDPRLNHRCEWTSGVHQEPCSEILKRFFRARRKVKQAKS